MSVKWDLNPRPSDLGPIHNNAQNMRYVHLTITTQWLCAQKQWLCTPNNGCALENNSCALKNNGCALENNSETMVAQLTQACLTPETTAAIITDARQVRFQMRHSVVRTDSIANETMVLTHFKVKTG